MRVSKVGPDGFEPSPPVPKTETEGVGHAAGSVGNTGVYVACSETPTPLISLPTGRNLHVNLHAGLSPNDARAVDDDARRVLGGSFWKQRFFGRDWLVTHGEQREAGEPELQATTPKTNGG